MQRYLRSKAGMSLISVMVTAALIGVFYVLVSKYFHNNMTTIKKVNDRSSLEDLRQYIRVSMNCTQTQASAPGSCTAAGTAIALKKTSTTAAALVVIPSGTTPPPTKVGNFSVKAFCYNNPKTINVQYSSDGTTWTQLFDIPLTCP